MTAQEGSILSLPTVDSGACRITPDGLPLLSRHNIWMKREYMPVSVSPISAQAADVASAGMVFQYPHILLFIIIYIYIFFNYSTIQLTLLQENLNWRF